MLGSLCHAAPDSSWPCIGTDKWGKIDHLFMKTRRGRDDSLRKHALNTYSYFNKLIIGDCSHWDCTGNKNMPRTSMCFTYI